MTTDELFALGLERTQTLARMIENTRTWYLGRRTRHPDELLSGYFEPKKGLAIDYFRKTIRQLANGGFKKANMKSAAAVSFRTGNERVLTMLKEMEPVLSQHISKEDSAAFRRALFFFRSGEDMFFDMLPRFEPIVRPTIRKLKVEAFCIDSLQRYLGAVAQALAIREAQLTGQPLALPAQKRSPLTIPAGLGSLAQLFGISGVGTQFDKISVRTRRRTRRFGHEGNGHKGPKTKTMEKQRKIFYEFLKKHPEEPGVTGKSRISLAHQCWQQHPEWNKAAKATGEAKGYASHKSLAQAQ